MKFLIIIFSFSMALCSCKTTAQSNHRKNSCDTIALKKAIEQNWKYNQEYDYYKISDSFLNKLNTKYRDCFYGQDTSVIINLLGKHCKFFSKNPYIVEKGDTVTTHLRFFISRPCESFSKQGDYDCYWLNFYFDKNASIILIRKEWTHMALMK